MYQDLDVQAARQSLIEQTRLNQIASQALQNAVETANMVGKQAIRHADVAADALWDRRTEPGVAWRRFEPHRGAPFPPTGPPT